jgi:hypothetical protein
MMAPLRQFMRLAKPWQRVVVGLVMVAVGWVLGIYILAALGAVFVILAAAGWVKQRRDRGAETPDTVPADADADAHTDAGGD